MKTCLGIRRYNLKNLNIQNFHELSESKMYISLKNELIKLYLSEFKWKYYITRAFHKLVYSFYPAEFYKSTISTYRSGSFYQSRRDKDLVVIF